MKHMNIVRTSILLLAILSADPASPQSKSIKLNEELSGFYRICGSHEGIIALRQAANESMRRNDSGLVDSFSHPRCFSGHLKITPFRIAAEYPSILNWNYEYDPNSRSEPCELLINQKMTNIPCQTLKQLATYYYAYYRNPSGEEVIVLAEIFSTQFLTKFLEAQKFGVAPSN
jgi:hypothetical protein